MKLKEKRKKHILIGIIALSLISILFIYVYFVNRKHNEIYRYNEVTFITPNQVLIFWKTEEDTLGYIKYGERKYRRDTIQTQTSTQPGEVHAVLIEEVPLDGIYISIHNDSDSFGILPKIFKVEFNEEEFPNEGT